MWGKICISCVGELKQSVKNRNYLPFADNFLNTESFPVQKCAVHGSFIHNVIPVTVKISAD